MNEIRSWNYGGKEIILFPKSREYRVYSTIDDKVFRWTEKFYSLSAARLAIYLDSVKGN